MIICYTRLLSKYSVYFQNYFLCNVKVLVSYKTYIRDQHLQFFIKIFNLTLEVHYKKDLKKEIKLKSFKKVCNNIYT